MSAAPEPTIRPRLDWLVDILVFSLPPLVTVALYLPSGLLMPVRLATLALACLSVWFLVRDRSLAAPRVTAWTVAIFGFMGLMAGVAMLRFGPSWTDVVQFGFIAVSALSMALLLSRHRTIVALLAGWFAAGALAALVGIWELLTGDHLPGNSPAQRYGEVAGWNEISSFFDNPNLYAYHCALVLLLLPIAWHILPGLWRWAILPYGATILLLLERSNGRMALLSVVVGALWWALRSRWGRIATTLAAAVTGVSMALSMPPGRLVYEFVYVALDGLQWEGKSTWVRAQMAKSGWWMAQQSDFLGMGPGGFAAHALDPENPFRYQSLNNAHWGMVEVLAEYGVPSLVVVIIGLGAAVVSSLRGGWRLKTRAGSPFDRAVMHGAGALALTMPIISISHSTWLRQPLTAVHIATLVALLAYSEVRVRVAGSESTGKTC